MTGGRGSVLGTVTGAVMMAVIASGCTLLGWRNPIQDIVIGAIIIAAVTLDQVRQRYWSTRAGTRTTAHRPRRFASPRGGFHDTIIRVVIALAHR